MHQQDYHNMKPDRTRRDVLKLGISVAGVFSGAGNLLEAQQPSESPRPIDPVRVGFVGVGNKGLITWKTTG